MDLVKNGGHGQSTLSMSGKDTALRGSTLISTDIYRNSSQRCSNKTPNLLNYKRLHNNTRYVPDHGPCTIPTDSKNMV